eukprot:scaffold2890_cov31-Phaeocystis_antarctica.AAC.1
MTSCTASHTGGMWWHPPMPGAGQVPPRSEISFLVDRTPVKPQFRLAGGERRYTALHPVTFCCDFVCGSRKRARSPSAGRHLRL